MTIRQLNIENLFMIIFPTAKQNSPSKKGRRKNLKARFVCSYYYFPLLKKKKNPPLSVTATLLNPGD